MSRHERITDPNEVDRLQNYMPIIVRAAGISDWDRKFCASMIALQRRKNARVSEKQVAVMQRIVQDFQDRLMRDDVIE